MRHILVVLFLLVAVRCMGQTVPSIPERMVSIDCDNRRVDDVLHDVSAQAHFEFAWREGLFDPAKLVSIHLHNVTVRRVIFALFGNTISYKVRDNYLILLAAPAPLPPPTTVTTRQSKVKYEISGYTTDATTGRILPFVSVYDSVTLTSGLSDFYGHYTISLTGDTHSVYLKVSHYDYRDTFIVVTPNSNQTLDISLRPIKIISKPISHDSLMLSVDTTEKISPIATDAPAKNVERYKFLDSLIGFEQVMQSRNLKDFYKRGGQVSLVPFVSSNGKMAGNVVNHFSLNVIGGYSGGTDGVEIGGVLNVDRRDVRWAQVAGVGNVVGGKFTGVQAAGTFNFDMGSLHGVQLSGGANIIFDTLWGVQMAAGTNIIRGGIYGLQVAGGNNLVTRDMDGFQLAGGVNVTLGSVNKVQGAGGLNYARNVRGVQVAGGGNVTLDTLTGFQVAGGFNAAGVMNGYQLGTFNFAKDVKGLQVGVFNFADTCSKGTTIGVLSFVKKGMHEIELSANEKGFLNISYRTGIPNFYNILLFGCAPNFSSRSTWTFGYGIGHRFHLSSHINLTLDAIAQHVNHNRFADYTNEWVQLPLLCEWRPTPHFAVAAGPVFNYYITGVAENDLAAFDEPPLLNHNSSSGFQQRGWIGGKVAVRFL